MAACGRSTEVIEAAGASDEDLLITLGDYVDRGPDSAGVVEWVMQRAMLAIWRRSAAIMS